MMDAGCHSSGFKEKYSNIRILFLPANIKLQPPDLGTIEFIIISYFFALFWLRLTDSCSKASDTVKSVDNLTAIRRISQA